MLRSDVERIVREAWDALSKAAEARGGSYESVRLLNKCEAESTRVEKEHRRFMSGAPYRARYALSVKWAARYQVVRMSAEECGVPKTWSVFCQWRADWPLAQALRESLGEKLPKLPEGFADIDYAGDIALGSKS